jgi:hypothetical protein
VAVPAVSAGSFGVRVPVLGGVGSVFVVSVLVFVGGLVVEVGSGAGESVVCVVPPPMGAPTFSHWRSNWSRAVSPSFPEQMLVMHARTGPESVRHTHA